MLWIFQYTACLILFSLACRPLSSYYKYKCKVLHMCWGIPSTNSGWAENQLRAALRRRTWGSWLTESSTWPCNVHSQSRKRTSSWSASKAAWPAGWGRGFCHSALVRPQPRGVVEGVPVHGRRVGIRWSLKSLPTKTTLWFYDSVFSICIGREKWSEGFCSSIFMHKQTHLSSVTVKKIKFLFF